MNQTLIFTLTPLGCGALHPADPPAQQHSLTVFMHVVLCAFTQNETGTLHLLQVQLLTAPAEFAKKKQKYELRCFILNST